MKKELLLLTGQGFLGLNLIKNFKKKFQITIVGTNSNKSIKYKIPKEIKVLNINLFKLKNFNLNKPYIIITTLNNLEKNFYNKFKKLVDNIKKTDPQKVIFISTAAIKNKSEVNSNSNLYQYIKNAELAEKICLQNFTNLTILRVANIFGPFKSKPSFIEKIIISSLHNLNFFHYKSNLVRSYIHVDEFCKIIKTIFFLKKMKKILYYISNKNFILSSNQIIKIFLKMNFKLKIYYHDQKYEILKSIIKNSYFEKETNFKFEKNFIKKINSTTNFYKNYYLTKKTFFL